MNLSEEFSFVLLEPFGFPIDNVYIKPKTLNWVVPDFGQSSGGHLNIFRMIYHLELLGYENRIILQGNTGYRTAQEAKDTINTYFYPVKASVSLGIEMLRPAWATIATSWQTAYTVRNFRTSIEKFYFVQDFEPYFYAQGSNYAFAEQTYKFGLKGITAGDWLATKLSEEYGMETKSFLFSYDKHLYRPFSKINPEERNLFFYARPVTERRSFELGILAISKAMATLGDKVNVICAGWDTDAYEIDFKHLNAGALKIEELPHLYSQCDAALVISMTNLSLLPIELMACGCPVISNKGENVEWLLNEENALLTDCNIDSISEAIIKIFEDDTLQQNLSQKSLNTALATSWEKEASKLDIYFKTLEKLHT